MPVNTKMKSVENVEDDLHLVKSLWGGTRAMRDAGKLYLPQEPGEEKENYDNRKNRSTLTNIFKRTINTYAGRLFSEPAEILNQPAFDTFSENVDLEGRDFNRFMYDLSRLTIRDGLRFILIDAPVADGVETRRDEQERGIRPYFIEVDRRDFLGAKYAQHGSREFFTQFRMKETATENIDEFEVKEVEQIRVIEPYLTRLYRKDGKGNWVLYQEIPTSIGYVPVVPVYADRQGKFEAPPPLMDMAWLNVEHWQKSSDQSNILHVARVPILHWAGHKSQFDEEGRPVEITVSPNTLAKSADPSARLEYVEHSGAAIGAGRQDLLDIEDRMVALGAEFATPNKSGDMTATEKAINESGDISDLEAFAHNLKDSITNAVVMAGEMMGVPFTGEIKMKTELGIINTPVNIQELVKIRANGDLSRQGLYEVLNQEWGTSLDPEIEQERIDSEPPALGGGGGFF